MKTTLRYIRTLLLVITLIVMLPTGNYTYGQTPPPPPPPPTGGMNSGHGLGGNQGPLNAPVGNGTEILIILGLVYSARNILVKKQKTEEE